MRHLALLSIIVLMIGCDLKCSCNVDQRAHPPCHVEYVQDLDIDGNPTLIPINVCDVPDAGLDAKN